jgi:hypothetical protein
MQGTGPGVDTHTVANTAVSRKVSLKSLNSRAGSEGALLKDALQGIVNLVPDGLVLTPEIYKRDGEHFRDHRSFLQPAKDASWVAGNDCAWGDVVGNYASCPDEGSFANGDPTHDHRP